MTYPRVALAELLTQVKDAVTVTPEEEYTTGGIYSFGRGIFARPSIRGNETRYSKFYRLRSGQFIYSRLFGWEGAIAVASQTHDGLYFSNEFPIFDIDESRVDARYLGYIAMWPGFHEQLRLRTNGMGNRRQRVNVEQLLAAEIPLPDLAEQHRITDRLEAHSTFAAELGRELECQNIVGAKHTISLMIDRIADRHGAVQVRVRDVASIINDLVHPGDDPSPATRFVGLEHIEGFLGERVGKRSLHEQKGRKFRFTPNDVLYGYLRPYQNKVWLADCYGLCSVEQFVLRTPSPAEARYLSHILRGARILDQATRLTNNLQLPRLRSSYLLDMEIPWPPDNKIEGANAELDKLRARASELMRLIAEQRQRIAALRPSLLNAAFAGQL